MSEEQLTRLLYQQLIQTQPELAKPAPSLEVDKVQRIMQAY